MGIAVEWFFETANPGFHGKVLEHPEVNSSSGGRDGSLAQMEAYIVESWNRQFPDDPKGLPDFEFTMSAEPWW